MKTIGFIIQKEFLQVFRNRAMLPIIFAMPIIQLLILANAATFEVSQSRVSLVDDDQSPASRLLVDRMIGSGYFTVVGRTANRNLVYEDLALGRTDLIMRVPSFFGRNLERDGFSSVQIVIDAEDGAAAGVIQSYLGEIISSFNKEISSGVAGQQFVTQQRPAGIIRIETSNWFNPELNYNTFMVPGILVLLITMIGLFLSSMNLVREMEIGTIEQLNVTPIRKYELIVGKLTPFWIIGLFELALGLVVAKLVFSTPTEGSMALVFLVAAVYLLVVLGIGLLISTVTHTQQQAMFIAWFIMVIFILMSGLFTPIESMPIWAQKLTLANPVAYFIEVMRRVMLKGAGFYAIWPLLAALTGYAVVVLGIATRSYSKVSA
jgi:ABC-2 type transport system permease protein